MYIKNLRVAVINLSSAGNTTIVPGGQLGPGMGSIRVYQVLLNGGGANQISFYSNTTQIASPITFTAAGAASVLQNTDTPWAQTLPGQSLIINTTTTAPVLGSIWYSLA